MYKLTKTGNGFFTSVDKSVSPEELIFIPIEKVGHKMKAKKLLALLNNIIPPGERELKTGTGAREVRFIAHYVYNINKQEGIHIAVHPKHKLLVPIINAAINEVGLGSLVADSKRLHTARI